jgi:hypothetical protein
MRISAARKKARALAAEATVQLLEQEVGCTLSNEEIPTIYNLRHTTPTTYRIIWNHWGTQQPDDDNVVARIKSYKDGICELIGINDKNLRLRGVDFIREKATKKTLTLIIE